MRIDFAPLSLAVIASAGIVSFVMLFCTWILAAMLSACRIETAKIRKWFTEETNVLHER